jgi:predicted metal-dependent peptidase
MKAKDKIIKARSSLVLTAPFFASLALRLKLVEDLSCDTMWTDGISMGYSPVFVEPLPLEEVKGLICHEVMHVACNHNTRRGQREFRNWNIACDYAVDPIVNAAGFTQPWETINPRYQDWEAERIYSDLFKNNNQKNTQNKKDDNGSNRRDLNNNNQPQTNQDMQLWGEVRDYPGANGRGASKAEKQQAEQAQRVAVKQAAQVAKSQGLLPGFLELFIQEITEPRIPWREILARFLTEHARNDYSWKMPNRRFLSQGLYLPELRNPELGLIALLVDTSGSISQQDLNAFASEVQGILTSYKTELLVVYVDAAVQGHTLFSSEDAEIKLELKGGGGTDFRPGYKFLEEHGHQPAAAVYLTDGYCRAFPDEPEFPILWALTHKTSYFKPPFGEVVVINQDVS